MAEKVSIPAEDEYEAKSYFRIGRFIRERSRGFSHRNIGEGPIPKKAPKCNFVPSVNLHREGKAMDSQVLRKNAGTYSWSEFPAEPISQLEEVLHGLQLRRKRIPSKYFYDKAGSWLFEEICASPEYYLTRTETSLLRRHAEEISELFGESHAIIEYGCGSADKISILLEACFGCRSYVGIEICPRPLRQLLESLVEEFPGLPCHGVVADFLKKFSVPLPASFALPRRLLFLGSSIGNYLPRQVVTLLKDMNRIAGRGGALLIGVDLKKPREILEAAYNDRRGITANFNINILRHINYRCDGNLDPEKFEHLAFYNAAQGRIEMHLVSTCAQMAHLGLVPVEIMEAETIHTENSYKYGLMEFQGLAQRAGWQPVRCWTDPDHLFSLHYLEVSQ